MPLVLGLVNILCLFSFFFYCMSHYNVQYYMCMISSVSIMLNASIPLFHQHLVFIVYESPLGLGLISLSIKIAFVNLKKAL